MNQKKPPEAAYQGAQDFYHNNFIFEPEKNPGGRIPKEHGTLLYKKMLFQLKQVTCLSQKKPPEAAYQRNAGHLSKQVQFD